jgi:hypothetical protein
MKLMVYFEYLLRYLKIIIYFLNNFFVSFIHDFKFDEIIDNYIISPFYTHW